MRNPDKQRDTREVRNTAVAKYDFFLFYIRQKERPKQVQSRGREIQERRLLQSRFREATNMWLVHIAEATAHLPHKTCRPSHMLLSSTSLHLQ